MNKGRPADLPDFERPPLTEVALGVQFSSINFQSVHAGLWWQTVRERFPKVEEQLPLQPTFETFGLPQPQVALPNLTELFGFIRLTRHWFITGDDTQLIQVQRDRLLHNWRKRRADQGYPRYEPLRAELEAELTDFARFATANKLGEVKPNQCEVSYINHIVLDKDVDPNRHLDQIFTVWANKYSDDYLKHVEGAQLQFRYVLEGEGEEPIGRLHAAIQPSVDPVSSSPAVQFALTARGKPAEETIAAAVEWLNEGRKAVVRGFASMTTEAMHQRWGRKHASQ